MPRETVPPARDEGGRETHPAWAMIGAHRVSHSGGAVLFDSDIRHEHYVTVTVSTASRMRDLNRDWLHAEKEFLEIAMSEAQWASFVSSMNVGSGVPATILRREGNWSVPGMPYEPRLAESMREVRDAADTSVERIAEAFAAYKAHKTVGNLHDLEYAIKNAPANMTFAAKSLSEHAENVVQRSRADVEAFMVAKAQQLGLDAADLGDTLPELTTGEPEP